MPAARRKKIDLVEMRKKFVKAATFDEGGHITSVEFFSPTDILDAQTKQATAALMAAADRAPTPQAGEMAPTPEMVALQKRIKQAEADGDHETAAVYQQMYDRTKWNQMSTWSG